LAFGLPILQRLAAHGGQALIVLPTRELALQVEVELQKLGRAFNIRTVVLIGGAAMGPQLSGLRRKPHVIIGTPGRLIDHLEQKNLALSQVKILVLDEGDRMFDMGFAPQLKRIFQSLPTERQTMLFSATMPESIVNLARAHMKMPTRVEIARSGTAAEAVTHELYFVPKELKMQLLKTILAAQTGPVIVFVRTKHGVRKIERLLKQDGLNATSIHSDRNLNQRTAALEGFKRGQYRIMVATDIAARGLHVDGIALVLNYDLPSVSEDYVHRIGRTGRAGERGRAISFATPDQAADVKGIERLIRITISRQPLPGHLASHPSTQVAIQRPADTKFIGHQSRRPFRPRRRKNW
jgi:ATP-dependent RNA helicase RhlE